MALTMSVRMRTLSGPRRSDEAPKPSRPIKLATLYPATRPAPCEDDRPIVVAYDGRKKGGTKRGKTPMAPPKKSRRKRWSRKSVLRGVAKDQYEVE